MATIPPVAYAAVDGFRGFTSKVQGKELDLPSKMKSALYLGVNSFTSGFAGVAPVPLPLVSSADGTIANTRHLEINQAWSPGPAQHSIVAGVAITVVAIDAINSALLNFAARSKAGVRAAGLQLTTGRG